MAYEKCVVFCMAHQNGFNNHVLQGWLVDGYSSRSLIFSKLFKKMFSMIVFFCAFVENYVSNNQLLWTRFVKTGASVYLFHGLETWSADSRSCYQKNPTSLTGKVAWFLNCQHRKNIAHFMLCFLFINLKSNYFILICTWDNSLAYIRKEKCQNKWHTSTGSI